MGCSGWALDRGMDGTEERKTLVVGKRPRNFWRGGLWREVDEEWWWKKGGGTAFRRRQRRRRVDCVSRT